MTTFTIPKSWPNKELRVLLIGCGGTGSEFLDELFRMDKTLRALGGNGLIVTAVDGDEVSPFNLLRQRFFPCDIGHNKAQTLIDRYRPHGANRWKYLDHYLDLSIASDQYFIRGVDLVITAVDSAKFRAQFGAYVSTSEEFSDESLWLDCGNGSSDGQVILGHLSPSVENRLPHVYDLYGSHLEQLAVTATNEPSCSHEAAIASQDYGVNRSASRYAAALLWQILRHGSIDHHGVYFDMAFGESTPLAIDPAVWAAYGYAPDQAVKS